MRSHPSDIREERPIARYHVLDFALNLLYGSRCPVCGRCRSGSVGGPCPSCHAVLHPQREARCVRCAVRLGPHCRTQTFPFRSTRAAFDYAGAVRAQVHAAKFNGQWTVCERLVSAFLSAVRAEDIPPEVALVVPVPMHWWSRRVRGVHLACALSSGLAAAHGIEHRAFALRQLRPSRPQYTLRPAERFRSVAGLFAVNDDCSVSGRHVLLVDDVMTTGATASACARLLRSAGASAVHVAVLARTPPPEGA